MDVKSVTSDMQKAQTGLQTSGTAPALFEPPQMLRFSRVDVLMWVLVNGTTAAVVAAILLFFLRGMQLSGAEAWELLTMVSQTMLSYGVLLRVMRAWMPHFGSTVEGPRALKLAVVNGVPAAVLATIFLGFMFGLHLSADEAWTHLTLVCNTLLGHDGLLRSMRAWSPHFSSTFKVPRAMALVLANGVAAAVLAAIFFSFMFGSQESAFEAWKHMGMVGQILFGQAALAGATSAARIWYGHAA